MRVIARPRLLMTTMLCQIWRVGSWSDSLRFVVHGNQVQAPSKINFNRLAFPLLLDLGLFASRISTHTPIPLMKQSTTPNVLGEVKDVLREILGVMEQEAPSHYSQMVRLATRPRT